ncbi:MFS transporter [Virgisporangium ochraceum]
MALMDVLAGVLRVLGNLARGILVGIAAVGRTLGRGVGRARNAGGAKEPGMIRLLDLHAASIAGDALIAIGLAGTIFFSVPAGEARGQVALYLLVTMLPFALLAPVVGPVLDRFRHGRRYALATTFLGRAFLAYLISENLDDIALYPAAFGILLDSRAYGVARSAAVPRLLPAGLTLSAANARASLFGTVAGAIAAPVGILAATTLGQPWPLRIATFVFLYGMVTALRLPPKADSEPPESLPRLFRFRRRNGERILSAPLIIASIAGTATLRALYGFLALYLAFSIREGKLDLGFLGVDVRETAALGLLVAALGVGTFLSTAVGSVLRIKRPAVLQAVGILLTLAAAGLAAWSFTLPWVALLCLVTALSSGLAKLAVDAVVQERTDDRTRASAFAHSETILMIAWVAGGALGLIPFPGSWGMVAMFVVLALGAARAVWSAGRLRRDKLTGTAEAPEPVDPTTKKLVPDVPTQKAPVKPEPDREPDTTRPEPATRALPHRDPGRTRTLPMRVEVDGVVDDDPDDDEPPSFHLYRPSGRS